MNKKDWKNTVKGRADYIRGLVKGSEVFGQKFDMSDIDALIVAVYMKGGEIYRENAGIALEAFKKDFIEKQKKGDKNVSST